MPLTESRLAEIAARHRIHSYTPNGPPTIPHTCNICRARWPCDAALLAQDLAALRQGLAGLKRERDDADRLAGNRIRELAALREGLAGLEFGRKHPAGPRWDICYVCGMDRDRGHAPGCALRALVAGGGG